MNPTITARSTVSRALRLAGALALAELAAVALAGGARAGTWALISCSAPDGAPAPIQGWTAVPFNGPGDYSGASSSCRQQDGAMVALSSDAWPQDRYSGWIWQFTAPGDSTIAGGVVKLGLLGAQGQAYLATPNNVYDAADVLANCQFNLPCSSNDINGGPLYATVVITHPGGTRLYAVAECLGPGQPGTSTADCAVNGGSDGVNAQATISAADIDLQSAAVPAAGGFRGTLLAPDASGTADLLFTATDPGGPGVANVKVTIDSSTVYDQAPDSNGGECQSIGTDAAGASEWLYTQPCKQSEAVDVPVDTTKLADGEHHLKVTVTDAAGNASTVLDQTITTANPPPALANGVPCAGAQLALTIDGKAKHVKLRYGRRATLRGRLACGAVPIPSALVKISSAASAAAVLTGPDGQFRYALPPGPSRSIRVTYTAYSTNTSPTATARIAAPVIPRLTIKLTPTHTHNYGTMRLSGQIAGGPYPPQGVTLLAQVREPGGWHTFAELVARHGHYSYRYTFTKTFEPITYSFRIALPRSGSGDYPYLTTATRSVREHVD